MRTLRMRLYTCATSQKTEKGVALQKRSFTKTLQAQVAQQAELDLYTPGRRLRGWCCETKKNNPWWKLSKSSHDREGFNDMQIEGFLTLRDS